MLPPTCRLNPPEMRLPRPKMPPVSAMGTGGLPSFLSSCVPDDKLLGKRPVVSLESTL